MKSLPFFIAIALVGYVASSSGIKTKSIVGLLRAQTSLNLKEAIQEILSEPKYVSLKPEEKLRILASMHDFLVKHLKNKQLFARFKQIIRAQ